MSWRHLILERTAAEEIGATVLDMTNQIYPGDPCPVVLNGMIVYRDGWHMTATFAASSRAGTVGRARAILDAGRR